MTMTEGKKDTIDFEIRFYEGILRRSPHFIQALMALGDMYTKRGLYQKGLYVDRTLCSLRPQDPLVLYNLACSYSLLEDIDAALDALQKAINNGYDDFAHLEKDSDLSNLRNDDRFNRFLAEVKKNNQPKQQKNGS